MGDLLKKYIIKKLNIGKWDNRENLYLNTIKKDSPHLLPFSWLSYNLRSQRQVKESCGAEHS